jgi:hypothetical protein
MGSQRLKQVSQEQSKKLQAIQQFLNQQVEAAKDDEDFTKEYGEDDDESFWRGYRQAIKTLHREITGIILSTRKGDVEK